MQEQNTTVREKGHHLTSFERGRIATLHSQGYSNRAIARVIGVCHQTISNELRRGEIDQVKKVNGQRQYHREYSPEAAQAKYEANRMSCHRPLKLAGVADFIHYFTAHLHQDGWSPDAAVGRAKLEGLYQPEEMVSTKTLYHYIDAQLLEVRNLDLLEKNRRRTKHHHSPKHKRLAGRSIEERPKSIDQRQEFGHFELDTVVGKRNGQESVILTLIERQSRCQILRLIDGRDADSVNYELAKICQEYGHIMKSVTADNGAEFAAAGTVLDGVADLYYAHPYRSSERGTNEAHNRMIRRDVPKGLSMDTLGPSDIQAVEAKLNNLPRRQSGYQTPKELFSAAAG
ncbi:MULTISPECIES: IS30 family transposase [Loigolactobacillus]|uniref:IS30 family transposase n=3 Tax=Loigolactobacillus coryniformis TaxID=1610 RepID=A0A2D1KMW8_9LACO|nr:MULTISPECIES: IS30 family transposase [Loigolactobacillus]MDN5999912.1 IS30 family transposase [Lacticaseibacillus paracasei]MDN6484461.1 IS30 family transposase [Lactiplantibacillus plantarum]MDN6653937.1 IS30 family transposase [Lactobacillus sp.]ATO42805.1 IS30 family transposase [Loigolactobacillus coryniformis subsp. torquens DSM 20004 = KCTC 3535]ATO43473.1 IS30 family transposase [Loigolactobacillus coryniformis subsp. torquens DSM 20004 = KCTC 3535]